MVETSKYTATTTTVERHSSPISAGNTDNDEVFHVIPQSSSHSELGRRNSPNQSRKEEFYLTSKEQRNSAVNNVTPVLVAADTTTWSNQINSSSNQNQNEGFYLTSKERRN